MANLAYINPNQMYYNACPNEKCRKKVLQEDDAWRCEKCQQTYPNCDPRLMAKVKLVDHTGDLWAMPSNQPMSEKLIGKNGIEVKDCLEGDGADEEYFKEYLKGKCLGDWYFGIMAKQEFYNGEYRMKYSVFNAEKPEENYNKCIKLLLENITAYDKFDS